MPRLLWSWRLSEQQNQARALAQVSQRMTDRTLGNHRSPSQCGKRLGDIGCSMSTPCRRDFQILQHREEYQESSPLGLLCASVHPYTVGELPFSPTCSVRWSYNQDFPVSLCPFLLKTFLTRYYYIMVKLTVQTKLVWTLLKILLPLPYSCWADMAPHLPCSSLFLLICDETVRFSYTLPALVTCTWVPYAMWFTCLSSPQSLHLVDSRLGHTTSYHIDGKSLVCSLIWVLIPCYFSSCVCSWCWFPPIWFESFLITHVHAVGLHQSGPPETSKSLPAKKPDPLSFSYHSVHIGLAVAYIKSNHFDACLSSYPLVSSGHTIRSLKSCA